MEETSIQTDQPPVPPTPWFKISLVIIGILIILGLFGNLYFLVKNQKPTAEIIPTPTPIATTTSIDFAAGWKVYENAKLGFSFKYPESLMSCEDVNFTGLISSGPYVNTEENQCEVAKSRGYPISFLLNKDDKEFQNFRAENYPNSFSNYKNTEMRIDNKNAEVISGIEKETLLAFKIIKIRMGDSFLIVKATGEERDITILDQILSTFKFLDQNQADPTAGWKTYTNTQYKYSLKYPLNWTITKGKYSGSPEVDITLNYKEVPFDVFDVKIQNHCENFFNCFEGKENNITIDGVSAYQEIAVDNPNRQDIAADSTFFEKDGNFFLIQCAHDFHQEIQTTCNQILSTFKFLQ